MSASRSVTRWISLFKKQGDPDAFAKLYERYWRKLVACAGKRIGFRQDVEGIADEAMTSFWKRAPKGGFPKLDDRDDLWRVLCWITLCKAIDVLEKENTDKRKPRGGKVLTPGDELLNLISRGPSEKQADRLNGLLEALRSRLPAECHPVLDLRLELWNDAEIAEKLDIPKTVVRARVRRVQRCLAKLMEED